MGNKLKGNFWKNRKVLVTGIDGFVGSHLGQALVERGARVIGLRWNNLSNNENVIFLRLAERITIELGSVTDYTLLENIFKKHNIDTCFHLAAQALVGQAYKLPLLTFSSNIQGTWNILEACRQSGAIKRVIIAASDKVYGNQGDRPLPFKEDTALRAVFPYDVSKACADMLSGAFFYTYHLPVAVSRCANIFGGGDLNFSRLIPGTMQAVILDKNPVIRSDGTLVRDYLYIVDAIKAYLFLAENLDDPKITGEAFNFSLGEPTTVLTLVKKIIRLSGKKHLRPVIEGKKKKVMEIDKQYLSSQKAKRLLGWKADISFDEGLKQTMQWYKNYFQWKKDKKKELYW